jgi:DNA-binding HxlR family transcriptional regulator
MKVQERLEQISRLDILINNPARLMIIYLLAREAKLDYIQLMNLTKLSSGNITTHLQKLLSAGYISQKKTFIKQKPNTSFRLTAKGSSAYELWGVQILAALPDKLQNNRQLNFPPIPCYSVWSRFWEPDLLGRFSTIKYDKGLQLLPPLTGYQI